MRITDELREWTSHHEPYRSELYNAQLADELTAIAARIDAEHERTLGEWDYWESTHIALPKDADGEAIHFGDEMVAPNGTRGRVVSFHKASPKIDFVSIAFDGYPRQLYWCHECRHYHAPTVVDVLREFANELNRRQRGPESFDPFELFAEYAKRLKLAGEDE